MRRNFISMQKWHLFYGDEKRKCTWMKKWTVIIWSYILQLFIEPQIIISKWLWISCDIIFLLVQMLFFHSCNGLTVRNLRILNSPRSHVSVTMCNHSTFSHISINSAATSPNTDGFDISHSNNILIENSKIRSGK